MRQETESLSEIVKLGSALASTAGAIGGMAALSPIMMIGSIAIGGFALYKIINSEKHGQDTPPESNP